MIAVIADDFTGAAEIGGVGLRYGLNVVIETIVDPAETADLLIIATNTRSLSSSEAAAEVEKITWQLLELEPELIYKKLDSVLRGNIADEISAQMKVLERDRAFIIAGNPRLGRTINDGIYSINNVPLHRTFFASDPEFPRNSSLVLDLIGSYAGRVFTKKVVDMLPEKGIIIGDVSNHDELAKWVDLVDENTLACGSAGFFDVMLAKKFKRIKESKKEVYNLNEKSLFVLGSLFPKSEKMINKVNGIGLIRMNMPDDIYYKSSVRVTELENWADQIVEQMEAGQKVVITVENKPGNDIDLVKRIRKNIGQLIEMIISRTKIGDLLIEGGATTFEVLKNLKIRKLYPFRELDLGIIQMRVSEYPGLCITTKPGSYSWPDSVEFENKIYISK